MWKKLCVRYKQYLELSVLILFMTVVSGLCHQTEVLEWLRFFGFQIFCLLIPGIAVMILLPMRNLKMIEKVLYSYAMGYMLTTVLYLFLMLTVGSGFLKVSFAVMAAAALIFVWRHKAFFEREDFPEESDDRMWIGTILAVFMITLIVASLRWRMPYIGESNGYDSDYVDWVRKIAMFKRDASAFLPMLKDSPYHYLGMIQQAAVAKLTDISAFGMGSQYSHIESSIFLGLSSYAAVTRLIKNKRAQIATLLLILFSSGFEEKSITTYIWHIYLVPMSYHIAQSLGVMIILLILIQLDEEFDFRKLLVMTALLMCCTGTKGATGAVIFCGIALACLYSFLIQKRRKMALVYFISAFVGFGLVFAYLTPTARIFTDRAQSYLEAKEQSSANEAETSGEGFVEGENAADEEQESLISKGLKSIAGYGKRIFYINPWTMLPMVIFICYLVVHRSIKKEYLILFLMTMIGTMLGYFIVFYGHSEMYFTLTVYPFAALLTGCFLERIFSNGISSRRQSVITASLSFIVVLFTVSFDYEGDFKECLIKGLDNLWIFHENIIDDDKGELIVDFSEYYAYEWVRTHTPPDAIILSNRLRNSKEWMLLVGFTEHDLVAFEGNLDEEKDFDQYADLGVDYIVASKYLSIIDCPENKGKTVFENDEMIICELY